MSIDGHRSTDLPPLYERWLRDALPQLPARETTATCHDCVMCSPGAPSPEFFRPEVKCCTYHPVLRNFSVGLALRDGAADALRAAISARVGVTPLAIGPSRVHELLYERGKQSGFGRSHALACPYFSDGGCTVWLHRDAICASYYCKFDRGVAGARLWNAIRDFLGAIERALSWHCALALELDPEALRALSALPAPAQPFTVSDLDGVVDEREYRAVWGSWLGREQELYRRCAELVEPMTWADVARVSGPRVEAARRALVHIQSEASDALSERLELAPLRVRPLGPDAIRVETAGPGATPLEIPRVLFDALRHFDGRATPAVRAAILEHDNLELDDQLLQRLLDFRILTPARQ